LSKAKEHLETLVERLPALALCRADIDRAFNALVACFRAGGKLLVCGNGGSAADAEHISGELLKGFLSRRPLDAALRSSLPPPLGDLLQKGLPAIPLGGFVSLSTAFANDVEPQACFAQLALALGRPGDTLWGISTSGDARNVAWACETAHAAGMTTIGLTGRSGGKLATLADICIRVPADRTPDIQEFHLPVYHCLCAMLEEELFGEQG
jgi:D-sedoheptulose 7-phosphate isomerase